LSTCRFLAEHLADCKVALVPGAKHRAHEENPSAYVALVGKHLREIAGLAPGWREARDNSAAQEATCS
jgi:hypothetical protein